MSGDIFDIFSRLAGCCRCVKGLFVFSFDAGSTGGNIFIPSSDEYPNGISAPGDYFIPYSYIFSFVYIETIQMYRNTIEAAPVVVAPSKHFSFFKSLAASTSGDIFMFFYDEHSNVISALDYDFIGH